MNPQSKIIALDCTLRDGGYYNHWDFSPELVTYYLEALEAAKVDVIEIGFRSPTQERFLGAYAYSTDDYLARLTWPKNVKMGIMINAKEFLQYEGGALTALKDLFRPKSESPVDLVRIAAHYTEIPGCEVLVKQLKTLGYQVGFNLMQTTGKTNDQIRDAAATIQSWNSVDVLYFADSLGNMNAAMVITIVEALRGGWSGPLGIHTHDNMGQGLNNSFAAIDNGVTWIDGTIVGMGRGAGNARTEFLLLEYQKRQIGNYYPEALFPLVIEEFEPLQKHYGWGPSLLYYLSAVHGIHPTYIQEMIGNSQYKTEHIMTAIEFLKKAGGNSYSNKSLQQAVLDTPASSQGSWSAKDWAKGETILIIGSGPGTKKYKNDLIHYIEKNRPKVICLNVENDIPAKHISAYMACHQTRVMMDANKYGSLKKPLIMPLGTVPTIIQSRLGDVSVLDYGMKIEKGKFAVEATHCSIPAPIAAAYALALGMASGASQILLAGFDGYDRSDPRQAEMESVFDTYLAMPQAVPLLTITPTNYPIPQGSVYMPQ